MEPRTSNLTAGTRLGPYEIESLIGTGGMGEVYKARDTRLLRTVAIKRLSPDHVERFTREARAIAALNHPHICQLYDIGPDYLVLEYLQGDTLRGPISPPEVVRLARQIADALHAAHEQGILHRDLKPANIMIVKRGAGDGDAKLLDFGIARQIDADPDVTNTAAGVFVGTPAYMSPEQADGKALDRRSDIFSFGAVLYEMLTGRRAFSGDSTVRVLSAVLHEDPAPPPTAPVALQRIVSQCLAKQPDQRFQTMAQVKGALALAALAPVEPQSSIAVLPFANLSADKENEYFADGLAEEIINALASVKGLKVIARTSAFSFKDKNEDVRHIAKVLGVTTVLEGSVRRSGERVRVTAQLIAAHDGAQLWSERYDRSMTDVFAMQDEIASAITTALKGKFSSDSGARHYTPDLAAYELFLRGRHQLSRFTPDAWNRARVLFEQAIAADPRYAEPHAELALGYYISGMHGMAPMREVAPFVRAEAERALALDPEDARPRFLLGGIALAFDYDWATGERHYTAAMKASNVSPYAHWNYASLLLRGHGRFQESAAEMLRAVEQDPLNATWRAIWAAHLFDAGELERSVAEARRAVEIEDYHITRHILGEALLMSGRSDEAAVEFERAVQMAPWAVAVGFYAAMLWRRGEQQRAEEMIRSLGASPMPLWGPTVYYLLTGQLDEGAEWFDRMVEHRDPFAVVHVRAKYTLALREHPRWPAIARKMNLAG